MKKLLLIAGIIMLIACVICLSAAALHFSVYRHALDGTPDFYAGLHRKTVIFSVIGIILAAIGTGCIILRFKV